MGDCEVDIFLAKLKQLITSSKLTLVIGEKQLLESLERKIKYLREFLKTLEINTGNKYPELVRLAMQIRDVIFEAENIVDLFVIDSYEVDNASLGIESVKEKVENLSAKVKRIYDNNSYDINGTEALHNQLERSVIRSEGMAVKRKIEILKIEQHSQPHHLPGTSQPSNLDVHTSERFEGGNPSMGRNTSKLIREKVVVGFEKEVKGVLSKLHDQGEGRPLEIVTILGPGGGGKTTLAREVYHHRLTSCTFQIRVWFDVSQDYNSTRKRDMLIAILKLAFPDNRIDYKKRSEDKLGEDVFTCLRGRKYLIVMDDIWGPEIWNDMQRSFPKDCKGSKILFTSRLPVQPKNISNITHCLACLTETSSWKLLQKKVFGIGCCPPELVGVGQRIAKNCKGLPLAIITIAGILARKDKTPNVWEEVAKHLSSLIAENEEGCMKILELSYNHLPPYLRACFIYIGAFPEDNTIDVRELLWLWIVEEFIQPNHAGKSLEAIANDYLIDLVERNLIMIARKRCSGEIKACRIHDLLRELCLRKAEEENFFVKINTGGSFSPSAADKYRRVITGSQFFYEGSLWPRARNLRSILCLCPGRCSCSTAEQNIVSFLVGNFKLLKVLRFSSTEYPGGKGIKSLVNLRYLAFRWIPDPELRNGWWLKEPFPFPLNLEIINLRLQGRGSDFPFKLPFHIFKMVKLRHIFCKGGVFEYHVSSQGPRIGSDHSSQLDNLQTLHRICGCDDCRSFLVRTPKLKKLGIALRGTGMIWDLKFLKCLETLKFSTYYYGKGERVLCNFVPGLKLPLTVTQLTLNRVQIIWEELSALQTLPDLEVLKITLSRCGPVWDTSEEGFSRLKYLKLGSMGIKEWNASEEQFPRLEVLAIEDCGNLKKIPDDYSNLYELHQINLKGCRMSLAMSALDIQDEQRNNKGEEDILDLHAKEIFSYKISTDPRFVAQTHARFGAYRKGDDDFLDPRAEDRYDDLLDLHAKDDYSYKLPWPPRFIGAHVYKLQNLSMRV